MMELQAWKEQRWSDFLDLGKRFVTLLIQKDYLNSVHVFSIYDFKTQNTPLSIVMTKVL